MSTAKWGSGVLMPPAGAASPSMRVQTALREARRALAEARQLRARAEALRRHRQLGCVHPPGFTGCAWCGMQP